MVGHPRRAFVAVLALVLAHYFLVIAGTADSSTGAKHPAWRCARPSHGFVPAKAQIPAIGKTVKVIQVKRKSNGQIGAGPTTTAGKWLMSMDPKTKPGERQGSVLLSGHTWPDGSALGNAMLDHLWVGNGIVLYNGSSRACYRIDKRKSYDADAVPSSALRSDGPERVVIVACSGKRLGPGNWTKRTIWYATPATPAPPPKQPSQPQPSSPPSNGTLIGGLLSGL